MSFDHEVVRKILEDESSIEDGKNKEKTIKENYNSNLESNMAIAMFANNMQRNLKRLECIKDKRIRSIVFLNRLLLLIDLCPTTLLEFGSNYFEVVVAVFEALAEECSYIINWFNGEENKYTVNYKVFMDDNMSSLFKMYVENKKVPQTDPIVKSTFNSIRNTLARIQKMKDSRIRVSSFLEHILFLIDMGKGIIDAKSEDEVILPFVNDHYTELITMIQNEFNNIINYINEGDDNQDLLTGDKQPTGNVGTGII